MLRRIILNSVFALVLTQTVPTFALGAQCQCPNCSCESCDNCDCENCECPSCNH